MSAWIVSRKHIDTLVDAIFGPNGVKYVYYGGCTVDVNRSMDKTAVGQLLLDENVRSVNCRYKEENVQEPYTHRCQPYYSPMMIVKSCQCYSYQSCEHDGWETSLAKAIIDALESKYTMIILKKHGYENEPWGIDEWEDSEPVTVSIFDLGRK